MTSVAIVDRVTVGQLELATPCTGWTLRRLLAHMIGQNYGFAAAEEGVSQNREAFADRTVGDTPAAEYGASATRVLAAFAAPGLLDGSMYLPEVRGGATLPATTAIGFHLIDYVAHGWDVAKSIGASVGYDREVLLAALRIAAAVPDEAKPPTHRRRSDPALPPAASRPWIGSSPSSAARRTGRRPLALDPPPWADQGVDPRDMARSTRVRGRAIPIRKTARPDRPGGADHRPRSDSRYHPLHLETLCPRVGLPRRFRTARARSSIGHARRW